MVTIAIGPPCIQCPASWLRWLMILIRLRSWVQTWQRTVCQGWGNPPLCCQGAPWPYSPCGPALSDQAAIVQMKAHAVPPQESQNWSRAPHLHSWVHNSEQCSSCLTWGVWYRLIWFANCPIASFGGQLPPLFSTTVGSTEPPA